MHKEDNTDNLHIWWSTSNPLVDHRMAHMHRKMCHRYTESAISGEPLDVCMQWWKSNGQHIKWITRYSHPHDVSTSRATSSSPLNVATSTSGPLVVIQMQLHSMVHHMYMLPVYQHTCKRSMRIDITSNLRLYSLYYSMHYISAVNALRQHACKHTII